MTHVRRSTRQWSPLLQWLLVLVVTVTAGITIASRTASAHNGGAEDSSGQPDAQLLARGQELFDVACVSCHGGDLEGTPRGPSLIGEGAAAVDFVLTTGRMPLAQPHQEARRGDPKYMPEDIAALTAYVGSFGGPAVPVVDVTQADSGHGSELFLQNCAGCHSSAGSGGVLGAGWSGPDLRQATPTQIADALAVGPGRMPNFQQLDTNDTADIVAYIATLQPPASPGGLGLGFVGPVAEGFVACLVGLGLMVGVARMIGNRE